MCVYPKHDIVILVLVRTAHTIHTRSMLLIMVKLMCLWA